MQRVRCYNINMRLIIFLFSSCMTLEMQQYESRDKINTIGQVKKYIDENPKKVLASCVIIYLVVFGTAIRMLRHRRQQIIQQGKNALNEFTNVLDEIKRDTLQRNDEMVRLNTALEYLFEETARINQQSALIIKLHKKQNENQDTSSK